jgi:hypothetical protein
MHSLLDYDAAQPIHHKGNGPVVLGHDEWLMAGLSPGVARRLPLRVEFDDFPAALVAADLRLQGALLGAVAG